MRLTEKRYRLFWRALPLTLTLLGHDVLMVADVHAVSRHPQETTMSHVTRRGMPDMRARTVLTHDSHADGCATSQPVVTPSKDDPGRGPICSDISSVALKALFAMPVRAWWHEPTASPGVRRALFQVYRI